MALVVRGRLDDQDRRRLAVGDRDDDFVHRGVEPVRRDQTEEAVRVGRARDLPGVEDEGAPLQVDGERDEGGASIRAVLQRVHQRIVVLVRGIPPDLDQAGERLIRGPADAGRADLLDVHDRRIRRPPDAEDLLALGEQDHVRHARIGRDDQGEGGDVGELSRVRGFESGFEVEAVEHLTLDVLQLHRLGAAGIARRELLRSLQLVDRPEELEAGAAGTAVDDRAAGSQESAVHEQVVDGLANPEDGPGAAALEQRVVREDLVLRGVDPCVRRAESGDHDVVQRLALRALLGRSGRIAIVRRDLERRPAAVEPDLRAQRPAVVLPAQEMPDLVGHRPLVSIATARGLRIAEGDGAAAHAIGGSVLRIGIAGQPAVHEVGQRRGQAARRRQRGLQVGVSVPVDVRGQADRRLRGLVVVGRLGEGPRVPDEVVPHPGRHLEGGGHARVGGVGFRERVVDRDVRDGGAAPALEREIAEREAVVGFVGLGDRVAGIDLRDQVDVGRPEQARARDDELEVQRVIRLLPIGRSRRRDRTVRGTERGARHLRAVDEDAKPSVDAGDGQPDPPDVHPDDGPPPADQRETVVREAPVAEVLDRLGDFQIGDGEILRERSLHRQERAEDCGEDRSRRREAAIGSGTGALFEHDHLRQPVLEAGRSDLPRRRLDPISHRHRSVSRIRFGWRTNARPDGENTPVDVEGRVRDGKSSRGVHGAGADTVSARRDGRIDPPSSGRLASA